MRQIIGEMGVGEMGGTMRHIIGKMGVGEMGEVQWDKS